MTIAHQSVNIDSEASRNPTTEYGSIGSPPYQSSPTASAPTACSATAMQSTGPQAIATRPSTRPIRNSGLDTGRESSTSAMRSRSSLALTSKARKIRPNRKIITKYRPTLDIR